MPHVLANDVTSLPMTLAPNDPHRSSPRQLVIEVSELSANLYPGREAA
jgi:hypothetical protein